MAEYSAESCLGYSELVGGMGHGQNIGKSLQEIPDKTPTWEHSKEVGGGHTCRGVDLAGVTIGSDMDVGKERGIDEQIHGGC